MKTATVAATVHGRYLLEDRGSALLLAGFHGYAEQAESHLEELEKIPGVERWSTLAVQALHPFYTRSGQVVASWMTSLDRELAIADNVEYVRTVFATLPRPRVLVLAGFSQGVPMAVRTAARAVRPDGLILLGGDIPADVREDPDVVLPPVLLGRGTRDEWYTEEKFKEDLRWLEERTRVTRCVFAGGHEWTDAFREAAGEYLSALTR
jgi:predicted esterase